MAYLDILPYIREKIPSTQELLPTYDYLYDENKSNWNLRSGYPANYPRNEFLESLNSVDNIKTLKNVEFTKIIGKENNNNKTISGFNVVAK